MGVARRRRVPRVVSELRPRDEAAAEAAEAQGRLRVAREVRPRSAVPLADTACRRVASMLWSRVGREVKCRESAAEL